MRNLSTALRWMAVIIVGYLVGGFGAICKDNGWLTEAEGTGIAWIGISLICYGWFLAFGLVPEKDDRPIMVVSLTAILTYLPVLWSIGVLDMFVGIFAGESGAVLIGSCLVAVAFVPCFVLQFAVYILYGCYNFRKRRKDKMDKVVE